MHWIIATENATQVKDKGSKRLLTCKGFTGLISLFIALENLMLNVLHSKCLNFI